jgi:hypothetical protein
MEGFRDWGGNRERDGGIERERSRCIWNVGQHYVMSAQAEKLRVY